MWDKLEVLHKNQRGASLLLVLISLALIVIVGTAVFVTFVEVFKGGWQVEAGLSASAANLTEVGGVVRGISSPETYLERKTFLMQTVISEYAVIALNGNIALSGGALVMSDPPSPAKGDIYANGNISLSNSARIDSDATATGTITIADSASIGGGVRQGYSPGLVFLSDPEVTAWDAQFKAEAIAGGTCSGSYTINSNQTLGPLYITGDLKVLNGDITLAGTVYVDGQIQMTGGSIAGGQVVVSGDNIKVRGKGRVISDNIPLVMSVNGNIDASGTAELAAVLYAPHGNIFYEGNANLYGAAVGRNVTVSGTTVTYPFTSR